eukprot:gnl/Chilomastix_cuspidata/5334.p1 GENE.gnl/Chilomastix_cuspidata/5334~~gnl/Chilomastix_cuspidata/5334.p1  ORF type:complete len:273 (-),score=110.42 gnl/Chilomastix_cuspidata/5334:88-906(-)
MTQMGRAAPLLALVLLLAAACRAATTLDYATYHGIQPTNTVPLLPPQSTNAVPYADMFLTQSVVEFSVSGDAVSGANVDLCTNADPATTGTVCYTICESQSLSEGVYGCFASVSVPAYTYYLSLRTSGGAVLAANSDALVVPTELYLTEFVDPALTGWSTKVEFDVAHLESGASIPGNMMYYLYDEDGNVLEEEEEKDTKDKITIDVPREAHTSLKSYAQLIVFDDNDNYFMNVPLNIRDDDTVYFAAYIVIAAAVFLILIVLIIIAASVGE